MYSSQLLTSWRRVHMSGAKSLLHGTSADSSLPRLRRVFPDRKVVRWSDPPTRRPPPTAPAARRGMMLGAVLLPLATSSLGVSPPPPPPPPGETSCAEIIPESSNAYEQSPDDWRFSLAVKVHWWVPKMHISIAFGEPVQISQVTGGASQVFYGPGAPSRLELPTVPSHTTPACRLFQWTRVPSRSSWTREFTTRIPNL